MNQATIGQLDHFLEDLFPFLTPEQHQDIIATLGREIPPPPANLIEESNPIYGLIDHALERMPFEQHEGTTREFLARFNTLSPGEVELLAHPVTPSRHQGVVKILRSLGQQAGELKISEMKGLIAEKLPSLHPEDRPNLIGGLSREIPPDEPPTFKRDSMRRIIQGHNLLWM